ncbi:MAG: autotransporter domain-containing protein [Gammaproteobacteria bacterium]|nr:autotransporter domain-containing protein [Gammaproteobacteria bacterium]
MRKPTRRLGTQAGKALASLVFAAAAPSIMAATLQIVVPGPYPENAGAGTLDVQLLRGASDVGICQVTGEIQPGVSGFGNQADAFVDFDVSNLSFNVTLGAAATVATQTLPINIIDDAVYEGASERISLQLAFVDTQGCDSSINVQIIQGNDVGTITEDEVPQYTLGFSQTNATVGEGDGITTYQVDFQSGNLDPGTYDMSVNVVANAGTASTADFDPHSVVFSFTEPGGQTADITITDDTLPEATETFTLAASASLVDRDGVPLGVPVTQPNLSIDIFDNDGGTPGFVEFAQTSYTVDEGAASVIVTIARSGGTTGVVSAEVSAFINSGDTATAGADFTAASGTVTWADGDGTPKTFTVAILEDTVLEPTETFSVEITNVLGGSAGNQLTGTVNITDNDDQVDPGRETVTGAEGDTVSVTFAVAGAAPFTLASSIGTVTPNTLPAPGNATFSFDIPAGTTSGTTFVATVTVTNTNGTAVDKDITITVVDADRVLSDIAGLTPNQLQLARYLDALCPRLDQQQGLSDEQSQILSACDGLRDVATTETQVRAALDAINPEELIVAATMALRLTSMQNGNLMQRINALRSGATGIDLAGLNVQIGNHAVAGSTLDEVFKATLGKLGGGASGDDFARWGLFANGNVKFGEKDATENEAGFDYDTIGITAGIDYRLRDNLVLGAALGYASVQSDFTRGNGQLDIDAWSASLFGTYFVADRYYLDGMLTYGQNNYDTTREITYSDTFGVVDETARGDTDGMQLSGGLAGGYDFTSGAWTVGPHIGAYYFDVDVDRFAESGASGYNMAIGEQSAQSFQLNGGGHLSVVMNRDWGVFIPHARIDYVHELMDSAEVVSVQLANDPFATDPSNPTPVVRLQTGPTRITGPRPSADDTANGRSVESIRASLAADGAAGSAPTDG